MCHFLVNSMYVCFACDSWCDVVWFARCRLLFNACVCLCVSLNAVVRFVCDVSCCVA